MCAGAAPVSITRTIPPLAWDVWHSSGIAENAVNEPRIRDDLPIMLGGGGERKTFGLAAPCAEVGRDLGTLLR